MSNALSVKLVGAKADAVRMLRVLAERGRSIRMTTITSREQIDEARAKKDEWVHDTVELLKKIFDQTTVADGFYDTQGRFNDYPGDQQGATETFHEEMDLRLSRLNVVLKRIEASPEAPAVPAPVKDPSSIVTPPSSTVSPTMTPATPPTSPSSVGSAPASSQAEAPRGSAKAILVVSHGVDHRFTEAASEFLGKLGLSATLQTREPGKPVELEGATTASFALMLMPSEDADNARPGSNQPLRSDIAFDMGFLTGRVGANRLAVLFPQGGEGFACGRKIPYIPIDQPGGWMLHLARHMKRAGVEIDLNKVL